MFYSKVDMKIRTLTCQPERTFKWTRAITTTF